MSKVQERSFDLVHSLIRRRRYAIALGMLLNAGSGRIRVEFVWDRNHAWYCVGEIAFRQDNFVRAVNAFKNAFANGNTDVASLLAIGNCYDQMSRPALAERYFRRALALTPSRDDAATATYNLANALFDQRRYSEAMIFYKEVSRRRDEIGAKARRNMRRIAVRISLAAGRSTG
jgi:tetratricopeptide (TPR) repeat protein